MNTENDKNHPSTEAGAMLAEMAADTREGARAADGSVTEVAAGWFTPQYLLALRGQLAHVSQGPQRFHLLRQAAGDVVAFQRGGHSAARLQLDREKLALAREKLRAAAPPAAAKRRDPQLPLTDADRQAIVAKLDEFFGLK